jgi:plasmid stabilization system protein ParE
VSDLKLDYLDEARSSIGRYYEHTAPDDNVPMAFQLQESIAASLLSIAESLYRIAEAQGGPR